MTDLKACPFCGGELEIVVESSSTTFDCWNCKYYLVKPWSDSEDEAFEWWDKTFSRPVEDELEKQVERQTENYLNDVGKLKNEIERLKEDGEDVETRKRQDDSLISKLIIKEKTLFKVAEKYKIENIELKKEIERLKEIIEIHKSNTEKGNKLYYELKEKSSDMEKEIKRLHKSMRKVNENHVLDYQEKERENAELQTKYNDMEKRVGAIKRLFFKDVRKNPHLISFQEELSEMTKDIKILTDKGEE